MSRTSESDVTDKMSYCLLTDFLEMELLLLLQQRIIYSRYFAKEEISSEKYLTRNRKKNNVCALKQGCHESPCSQFIIVRILLTFNQTSANNLIGYHYSSKTRQLKNNSCKYFWHINGPMTIEYSSLHIHNRL